jgi:pimeloyl-ACP methyl ester carboxylesterase
MMFAGFRSGRMLRRSLLALACATVAATGASATAHADGLTIKTVCFTVYNGTDKFPSTLYGLRYTNGHETSQTPAIVLVHGIASSTANWDFTPDWSLARKLANEGYVVISYDRLGYARSTYAGDPSTLYTYNQRDHLHQLVMQVQHGTYLLPNSDNCGPSVPKSQTTLANPNVVIVGHSAGGSVVQGYPGTYHDVKAMVQADISGPQIDAPANPIPPANPTPPTFPADPNLPVPPPGYSNFFDSRQACEAFNFDWAGAVQAVVDVACDPTQFVVSPITKTPAGLPSSSDLIKQTGPIPILLTWGDSDGIAPIYNDELQYRFWQQNCHCDVSRMYLPDTGHLFMAHKSLNLWIDWVTSWLTQRGLAPMPGAATEATPLATDLAPDGPTKGETAPPTPAQVSATAPAAAAAPAPAPAVKSVSKCIVPNLKGLTVAAATAKLAKANCDLGRTHSKVSRKVKAGRVLSQSHSSKASLKAGSKVNLVVARKARAASKKS